MNNKNSGSGGLGLAGVLTVVFVVLKLVGVIDWSWWWVFAPIYIDLILYVLILGGMVLYYTYDERKYTKQYGKNEELIKKWKF